MAEVESLSAARCCKPSSVSRNQSQACNSILRWDPLWWLHACLAPTALILRLKHQTAFLPVFFSLPPSPCVSSSLRHNLLLTLPFPSLHLLLFFFGHFFCPSLSPSLDLSFSLPLSFSISICAYMFVKIYRSPVVPSHSHACSVSLSHSSVHKTRSLWPDIKEKGGEEKRDRFSSVP